LASSTHDIEEGLAFKPKFDADGLITAVVTDSKSGDLLMVKALWKKGETSGHIQRVIEIRVDCDQDVVWLKVDQQGAGACHTGRRSCFYRAVPLGKAGTVTLEFRDADKKFDPEAVYKK